MRRHFGTVAIFMAVALLLVGLPALSARREVVLWLGAWICQNVPGDDLAWRMEEAFEAEYPDVDLKIVPVPWEGMLEKFLLAAQTGNLPDLLVSESFLGWTQLFASYGHFMDLTDLMMEIGEETFFPGVLEGHLYKGRYYSIPYRNSTRVLVYNKDMFQAAGLDPNRPPETWAELLEYAKKLTRDTNGDGIIDQWGFDYPVARFCTVAPEYLRAVLRSYGADILSSDMKECTIDTPEAIEAIRFYTDLVTKHKVVSPEVISYSDDDDWRAFGAKLTAMAMVGPWALSSYDRLYPDLNYGVAPIPSNTPGVPGPFGLIHMGWMVSKHTKVKEDCYNVIRFTVARPEINAWYAHSTPANRHSWSEPAFLRRYRSDVIEVANKQMEHAISSILLLPTGPQIAREVNVCIQRIILGMDVETAVSEAKVIIDELLKEAWEKGW
ncbi:sugar ABC transporter substrate-binding protein [Candidatus Bipolaricaulota bacterium]|nr:sugar ABC transporter substrate-binding protein [Candidatus Bipolaricaulota bacterium]